MKVYVINKDGKPLMPTRSVIARLLLKDGKTKVIRRNPFAIKLLYQATEYKQEVVAGMDTGSQKIGCAAITNGEVVYKSETELRSDVSKKMQRRKMYRRNRRSRKTRYRKPRFLNRGKKGKLAPSLKSKVESHLREKRFVESILPVTKWKVELASFDIHKISNSNVFSACDSTRQKQTYQNGQQKGFY